MAIDLQQYQEFIQSKRVSVLESGFDVAPDATNPKLFPFQRDIVRWALKLGKAAIFAAVGLGKTGMQLTWADHVARHTGKRVLVLAPLAVSAQTIREGVKFGVEVVYRPDAESIQDGDRIIVTNYERLEKFEALIPDLGGVVLDESSILKSFDGKTRNNLTTMFSRTPYRLACTATPAPNDHMELGQHSEFLGVKPADEMLATWFVHDSARTQNWRLKGHAESDFWRWLTTWAVCITKPADLGDGYDMEGYDLPALHIVPHYINAPQSAIDLAWSQGKLLPDAAPSSTELARAKRLSLPDRIEECKRIVAEIPSDDPILIWCHLNDESDALREAFPEAVEVRGSDNPESKADKLLGFTDGKYRILITKPSIAGFGMNWQHCNQIIFFGLDFSFEGFYQAKGRNHRYGQEREVFAHVIFAETEGNVPQAILRKQSDFEIMQSKMAASMKEHGLFRLEGNKRMIDTQSSKETGKDWTMYLGDCVTTIANVPDNSIHLSVYSPPFAQLYVYSDHDADMGNSASDEEFFQHYKFLIAEKFRVTKPGRLTVVHCQDLPMFKWKDGEIGLKDFSGQIIQAHLDAGWVYHSRITIWKDPVTQMQRTKAIGLLHKQFEKDSTVSRVGYPDYLLIFRKPGTNDEPVKQKRSAGDYIGTEAPIGTMGTDRSYSIEVWQRYASPVWFDIDQTRVLNNFTQARGERDERHICPLQLDVIARSVDLWSNPGDTVLSPFAGIGSEGYEAIRLNRKFIGIELKPEYFNIAVRNLKEAERVKSMPTLFNLDDL